MQPETSPDPVDLFAQARALDDQGNADAALEAYRRCAEQGSRADEKYVSCLRSGQIMEALGQPFADIVEMYEAAAAACPTRAEALYYASKLCFAHSANAKGYEIAKRGIDLQPPAEGLLLQPWIYHYGLLDQYSINAYWAGFHKDSLDANLRALASGQIPHEEQARFVQNARFASAAIKPDEPSWPVDAPVPPRWRNLHTRPFERAPRVLVAILAKQKAPVLPSFLARLAAFDYPKDRMVLYVRTNNNTDATRTILADWLKANGDSYAGIEFDDADLPTRVEDMGVHDWNATRLAMIRAIRNTAMAKTAQHDCDFFLPIDVDNFVAPCTLRELVALDLPIVAPLVREAKVGARYANIHAKIDANGYFLPTPRYDEIVDRKMTGIFELPVVHCTYLVRADVIPQLTYEDGSGRFDYVIFSHSARRAGIPQYLDNRQLYGYLTLDDDVPDIVGEQLRTLEDWFVRGANAVELPY